MLVSRAADGRNRAGARQSPPLRSRRPIHSVSERSCSKRSDALAPATSRWRWFLRPGEPWLTSIVPTPPSAGVGGSELLEEATATLGEQSSQLRVRLLGGLARALDFQGDHERGAVVR